MVHRVIVDDVVPEHRMSRKRHPQPIRPGLNAVLFPRVRDLQIGPAQFQPVFRTTHARICLKSAAAAAVSGSDCQSSMPPCEFLGRWGIVSPSVQIIAPTDSP